MYKVEKIGINYFNFRLIVNFNFIKYYIPSLEFLES